MCNLRKGDWCGAMLVYAVAAIRCAFTQRAVDFGALFSIWVSVAASHSADAYWAATVAAALVLELALPVSLALTGPLVVGAHGAIVNSFEVKHIGAILISLASLSQFELPKWIKNKRP